MASPSTSTLRSGAVSRLSGGGALEKSSRTRCLGACCWKGANRSPPNQPPPPPKPPPNPPLLRGCGSDDSNRQRNRDSQRDQRAALGENAQKGFWLCHALVRNESRKVIIAESGRKRADFAP